MFIAFFAEGIGIWLLYLCASHPLLFVLLSGVVFFAWGPIGDRNWRGGTKPPIGSPSSKGPSIGGLFGGVTSPIASKTGKLSGGFQHCGQIGAFEKSGVRDALGAAKYQRTHSRARSRWSEGVEGGLVIYARDRVQN